MTGTRGDAVRAGREAVVELWRQGQSAAEIAGMLGFTRKTVQSYVESARKADPNLVLWRSPHLTAVQSAEICALKAEGRSHAAIARALGVGKQTVSRTLRRAAMVEVASNPLPAPGDIGSQIVAMWEAGHTGHAIADELRLSRIDYVYEIIGRTAPERRRLKGRLERVLRMQQQVIALHQQKLTHRKIAHELGISRSLVAYYVQRGLASGTIARCEPVVSDAQAQKIIALNAAGNITGVEIARRFAVDKSVVYRVLRSAGVQPSVFTRRRQLEPKITALWEAGWKSNAIADACSTTPRYVQKIAAQAAQKNPALRRLGPRLSAAEIERIGAFRREGGYSGAEIAELLDVEYNTIIRTIRKLARSDPGLALHSRLVAKNRLPEVLLLTAQGWPPAAIAERFSVSPALMRDLLWRLRHRAKTRGSRVSPGVELQPVPEG